VIPFASFMEGALYGPDGFYTSGGGAGRRRDFLTSPEVGPLFGAVMARAIDSWWMELGRPDPFVVVEAGAGPGTLARAIVHARPAVLSAMRYVLVDRSPAMRSLQREHLPIGPPEELFGPSVADSDTDAPVAVAGRGPIMCALADLPAPGAIDAGLVLANELLDNLPFEILERTGEGWATLHVSAGAAGIEQVLVAAPDALTARLPPEAWDAPIGARVPLLTAAVAWLNVALGVARRGRVVAIDYGARTTSELAGRADMRWLRTYRGHERGHDPFDAPGSRDITTDVAVDQLAALRAPVAVRPQTEFLRAHGIDHLVEEGRAQWEAHAARPTLADITARSRATEAAALTDPAGLGGFLVIEWTVP
jgi:SAM-dependent MidA family methyltransferase